MLQHVAATYHVANVIMNPPIGAPIIIKFFKSNGNFISSLLESSFKQMTGRGFAPCVFLHLRRPVPKYPN